VEILHETEGSTYTGKIIGFPADPKADMSGHLGRLTTCTVSSVMGISSWSPYVAHVLL